MIHRAVLLAFVGPPLEGEECRHLDGDHRNNALSNLAWGTRTENAADRRMHGTQQFGDSHPCTKLPSSDVAELRRLRAAGASNQELAERFGISVAQASRITRGQSRRDG